jgi:hypothetical protein
VRDVGINGQTIIILVDPGGESATRFEYKELRSNRNAKDGWLDLVWAPDGTKLAVTGFSVDLDSGWCVIEIPTGKVVFRAKRTDDGDLLGWSSDGTSVLVSGGSGKERGPGTLRWVSVVQ